MSREQQGPDAPQAAPDGGNRRNGSLEAATSLPCVVCGRPLEPQRQRRGEAKRYCSDRCRRRAWEARHPRLVGGRKRPRRLWRVVDREALPPSYVKAVPDTLAIGKALARGEEIPGVERLPPHAHPAV